MTDLLTPEEVRKMGNSTLATICLDLGVSVERLCRDYLTLWDRNKELETTVGWYEAKHPND